jgi:hypothetical protein
VTPCGYAIAISGSQLNWLIALMLLVQTLTAVAGNIIGRRRSTNKAYHDGYDCAMERRQFPASREF